MKNQTIRFLIKPGKNFAFVYNRGKLTYQAFSVTEIGLARLLRAQGIRLSEYELAGPSVKIADIEFSAAYTMVKP